MKQQLLFILLLLMGSTGLALAEKQAEVADTPAAVSNEVVSSPVYVRKLKGEFTSIYRNLFNALENNGYFVIFEPNIGKNLSHFAQRWGQDYNRNKLEEIRSMVFCNGWYANQVGNHDPEMLALCPLHLTMIHKAGETRILFVRPGVVAKGSAAEKVAKELELDVIKTIESISG